MMAQDPDLSWYFAHGSAAQRYDAGRPRFHHLLLPTIRSLIGDCQRDRAIRQDIPEATAQNA